LWNTPKKFNVKVTAEEFDRLVAERIQEHKKQDKKKEQTKRTQSV
jgi:adenosyl cobinamide kinase/adenosyl cobinamide phosphate guanylyltransferase